MSRIRGERAHAWASVGPLRELPVSWGLDATHLERTVSASFAANLQPLGIGAPRLAWTPTTRHPSGNLAIV